MAKRPQKNARQRHKRAQKRRLIVRAQGGSVYRRIGGSGELVACYINAAWADEAMASIHILRRVPTGGHALGSYLVDLGCVGLKDAWGRLNITYQEFNESIIERAPAEIELVRVEVGLARRLVAGGIRFAHQNGFRLPPRYERWVALLGDIGDWRSADLSDFGVDGRLRYIGSTEDLKRRLVGSTVDEFLARDDVEYILGADEFTLVDDDELAVEEVAQRMQKRGVSAVRRWCFANGVAPHPRLAEAWEVFITSLLQVDEVAEDDAGTDAAGVQAAENLSRLLSLEAPAAQAHLVEALDQIRGFMTQFDSPDALFEAIGVDDEEPD